LYHRPGRAEAEKITAEQRTRPQSGAISRLVVVTLLSEREGAKDVGGYIVGMPGTGKGGNTKKKGAKTNVPENSEETEVAPKITFTEGSYSLLSADGLIEWLWHPLENGQPPEPGSNFELLIAKLWGLLCEGHRVMVHCSAGIHRTGMCAYALLRWGCLSKQEALSMLSVLREQTSSGVQPKHIEWGDQLIERKNGVVPTNATLLDKACTCTSTTHDDVGVTQTSESAHQV